MKQAIDRLVEYGYIQGKDLSICFEEMLDFFIESFDVKRVMRHKCDYAALFKEREKENPVLFELMRQWLTLSAQGIENRNKGIRRDKVLLRWGLEPKGRLVKRVR